MAITVVVRSAAGGDASLTFDGMQRVVIGRGASSDVRVPEPSVSHRHATLEARGPDFVLVDEGSTNGTFVGQVRVAPHTSRVIRSGDTVRVGRVWLELRIDQTPATRDLGAATRELALALVSQALAARGADLTARVRVLEGKDQGAMLPLVDEGRAYVLGRGAQCDLPLSDGDASREHALVARHGNIVFVRDLGAKNGTWLGEARAPENRDVPWRPALMMQIGRTVLALEEPVSDALARIESAPDDALPIVDAFGAHFAPASASGGTASSLHVVGVQRESSSAAPIVATSAAPTATRRRRTDFSIADRVVMATAICVLALSVAGLVWLLHG